MRTFWVLGAGRFGSLAVRRILRQQRDCRLLVVDHDLNRLEKLGDESIKTVVQDAVTFLLEHPGLGSEWIVPAVPVHVAFLWLCQYLSREVTVTELPVPQELDNQVPNALRARGGGLYTSFATFRCPDDCEEPADRCTVTGKLREAHLFDVLRQVEVPGYNALVVRSQQLAPGVGGYRFCVLWWLLDQVRASRNPVLVATACRCHGVVHALQWSRRTQSV